MRISDWSSDVCSSDLERVANAREAGFPAVRGNIASEKVMLEAKPERAKMAVFAIPHALEAGEAIARLKALNPAITVLARAHSDTEVRHLLEHGADGAVLAERDRKSTRLNSSHQCASRMPSFS